MSPTINSVLRNHMYDDDPSEKNLSILIRFVDKASRTTNSEDLWVIVVQAFREILPGCCFCVWLHDKEKHKISRWIYEPQQVCKVNFSSIIQDDTEPLAAWFKSKKAKNLGVEFNDERAWQFGLCGKGAIRLIPLRNLAKTEVLVTICSPIPFPKSNWDAIDAMARVALQSLERIRAEDERKLLNLIARQANQSKNRDAFLDAIIGPLKDVFSAKGCSIFLYNESRRKLILGATSGLVTPQGEALKSVEYSIGEGLTGWVAKRRKAARIFNTKDHDELFEMTQVECFQATTKSAESPMDELPGEPRSFLGMPILMQSGEKDTPRLIGVLRLHRKLRGLAFYPEDERLARAVCAGLAPALDRWNLLDNDSNLTRSLFKVLEVIHAEVDRDKTLKAIAVGAKKYFGGCAASIFLKDDDGWRVAASDGYDKDSSHHHLTLRSNQGLISVAAIKLRTIAVGNVAIDSNYRYVYHRTLEQSCSEICTPIISLTGDCRGVLSVESDRIGAFRQEDERTIQAIELFAKQAAVALNRAEVLEERTKWQENLVHVTGIVTTSTVASGLAHELKNGLTLIDALATGIERDPSIKSNKNNIKKLKDLQDISQDLFLLSKRLMDLSKVGAPNKQIAYLNDIVEETVSLLKPIAQDRKLSIETKLEATLSRPPGSISGIPISVDQRQIAQVLTNLVLNALDASHRNQVIIVSSRNNSDNTVTFSVEDFGKGISPANKNKIFGMFFTTKPHGFGIGLHVVRFLVNQHGGKIEFTTKEEAGTKFTVILPKYKQERK